jgi:hypothetical protein
VLTSFALHITPSIQPHLRCWLTQALLTHPTSAKPEEGRAVRRLVSLSGGQRAMRDRVGTYLRLISLEKKRRGRVRLTRLEIRLHV